MSSQDIYLLINKEIFTDPYYNFCSTDNKKLVAWYFLNVLSFSEDQVKESVIRSDANHFIDLILFDDENGVAYVAGTDFRGIHDKLDILSFNKPFNFFKYMISASEYELTGDPVLDRRSFYFYDCIKRGYEIVFLFITTASFDEQCVSMVNAVKSRVSASFDFEFSIELVDGQGLSERYYEADSLERCKQQGFESLGALPENNSMYACDLPLEDRRAMNLIVSKLRNFWKSAGSILDQELLPVGEVKGADLQLFAILQGYCASNRMKNDLLPPISVVYYNLERNFFTNRMIALSASWVSKAFAAAKKRNRNLDSAGWIRSEICLSDIRNTVEDFFSMYSSSLVHGSSEASDYVSRAYKVPDSEFMLPCNRFFLIGKDDMKASVKSARDMFYGCMRESAISEDDIAAADGLISMMSERWMSRMESLFGKKDAYLGDCLAAISCIAVFGCFAVFSEKRTDVFPSFKAAIDRLDAKYLLDELIRITEKSVAKAYDKQRSRSSGTALMADAWAGTRKCYSDSMVEISKYFRLLELMNGDSSKIYAEYAKTFSMKTKEFKYHLNDKGFKEL